MKITLNKIHLMNCVAGLLAMEPKSVHCIVTSPPYWALRDYGLEPTLWPAMSYTLFGFTIKVKAMKCCLGLETSVNDYIGHMVYIFRLAKNALRDDGTLWLNIGDSYAANQKSRNDEQVCRKSKLNGGKASQIACKDQIRKTGPNIKAKDMIGVPWMLAFALREDGWYLRPDIIWHKRNCMPESCNDRCTKNHEYVFLLSKSKKYYFDQLAIATPIAASTANDSRLKNDDYTTATPDTGYPGHKSRGTGMLKPSFKFTNEPMRVPRAGIDTRGGNQGNGDIPPVSNRMKREGSKYDEPILGQNAAQHRSDRKESESMGLANKRSVWSLSTAAFKEAHFAVFPVNLITDPIKASTSEHGCCIDCGAPYRRVTEKEYLKHDKWFGDKQDARNSRGSAGNAYYELINTITTGWIKTCRCKTDLIKRPVVMDMFTGSGTTPIVSVKLGCDFICFEQNAKYVKISERRMHNELGIFNPVNFEMNKGELI